MKIGFSQFWTTLINEPHPNHPENWNLAMPVLTESLEAFREFGITSIELKLTERIDVTTFLEAVENVLNHQFHITFHAASRINYPDDAPWQIKNITDVTKILNQDFGIVPLWVIHPLYGIGIPRERIYSFTREYLEKISLHLEGMAVKLALEILRNRSDNEKLHIGDSYAEILGLLSHIDGEKWGICWDFGHAFSTFERNLQNRFPPKEFIQRVIHCHVHDSQDQITHLPLGKGKLPIQQNIRLLAEHNYDGIFNLEIVPHKVNDPENFMSYLRESVSLLKEMIKTASLVK